MLTRSYEPELVHSIKKRFLKFEKNFNAIASYAYLLSKLFASHKLAEPLDLVQIEILHLGNFKDLEDYDFCLNLRFTAFSTF